MKTVEKLARDCLELPVAERMHLVRTVLEASEGNGARDDVESAWEEEIVARVEAVREGRAESVDAEEVFAELDRRFPG